MKKNSKKWKESPSSIQKKTKNKILSILGTTVQLLRVGNSQTLLRNMIKATGFVLRR